VSYEEIGHLENDASACKGRMPKSGCLLFMTPKGENWAVPDPMNLITRLQAKILQQPIDRECGTLDHCHNEINADH
jgi:hypothetical protein